MRVWTVVLLLLSGCLSEFPAAPTEDAAQATDGRTPDVGRVEDGLRPDARPRDGTVPDGRVPMDGGRDAAAPEDADVVDGRPQDDARPADASPLDASMPPDACVPSEEICNGIDDDCNGRVDDLAVLQAGCRVPGRNCVGRLRCDPEQALLVCVGVPDAEEHCDGEDEDCDGTVDEGALGTGGRCVGGVGACERGGNIRCMGGELACDAVPGPVTTEICNASDDDCDGVVDNVEGLGGACTVGIGACASMGHSQCGADEQLVCDAQPGQPSAEVCNGMDDDCNEEVDDVDGLGEACRVGIGACQRVGERVCVGNALDCDATPGPAADETCNDRDDDCDGRTDEGDACVAYALRACKAWLGWARPTGPDGVSDRWGTGNDNCPTLESDQAGTERCVGSPGDSEFRALTVGSTFDSDSSLGIAFTCNSGVPAVDTWIQSHCRVTLAHAPVGLGGVAPLDPAACAASVGPRVNEGVACVTSRGTGEFHPLWLPGPAVAGDELGVAFRCDAPGEASRAEGLEAGLTVALGYLVRPNCAAGEVVVNGWPGCGALAAGVTDRCVESGGDGNVHGFALPGPVDCHGLFGIALRRVP